ncbi:MAG: hypothetical protein HQL97_11005 [Magnetococcales bacterium]|nr:hypothetical protein [Magnetococcales bacterium]
MNISESDEWIVDLDGLAHRLGDGRAEPVSDPAALQGDKWVVSDFGGAMARFMTVEAPLAYAEVVARRRLQESGEAQEHARLLTHWKRARGKTSTELYFTVAEGERLRLHEDRAHDDPHHHLLFSVHLLPYLLLNQQPKDRTVAVLFEHDRHVDILLGRSGQVLAASRISSYGSARVAKENLAESVASELRALVIGAQATLNRILHFGWLLGEGADETARAVEQQRLREAAWVGELGRILQAPSETLPATVLKCSDEGFVVSAIPALMRVMNVSQASSPVVDRLQYQAQRLLPNLLPVAFGLTVVLFLIGVWLNTRAGLLDAEANRLEREMTVATAKPETVDPALGKMVTFVDGLARLRASPSWHELLKELHEASDGRRIVFDQVTIEQDDAAKIQMSLKGRVQELFAVASADYEAMAARLRERGFQILSSELSTDVTELRFNLKLERGARP